MPPKSKRRSTKKKTPAKASVADEAAEEMDETRSDHGDYSLEKTENINDDDNMNSDDDINNNNNHEEKDDTITTTPKRARRKPIFDPSDVNHSKAESSSVEDLDDTELTSSEKKRKRAISEENDDDTDDGNTVTEPIDWTNKDVLEELSIGVLQEEVKRRSMPIKGNRKALINKILKSNTDFDTEDSEEGIETTSKTVTKGTKLVSPESVFSKSYTPSKKSQGKREKPFDPRDAETWTLAELREYLRAIGINAYDNKQKIMERYMPTIKANLRKIYGDSSGGSSSNASSSTETAIPKPKPPTQVKKGASKKLAVEQKETPKKQTNKESHKPPTKKDQNNVTRQDGRLNQTVSEKQPTVDEVPPTSFRSTHSFEIVDEAIGPTITRSMPFFADPSIHKSFELSYRRKHLVQKVDQRQINPYFSQLTSSYSFISNRRTKKTLPEAYEIPDSEHTIKDPVLDRIVKEEMEKNSKDDLSLVKCIEACSEKEDFGEKENISTLCGLHKCTSLETIIIQGTRISSIFPLSKLEKLKQVFLARNRIASLEHLPPFAETVNLSFNVIRSLRFPSSLCDTLVYLNLSYNHMFDVDNVSITSICSLCALKELDLSGNSLTDASVAPLANAKFKKTLQSLRLNNNYITNLSFLTKYYKVSEFLCSSNFILDLTPLVHLRSISEIFLDDNPPLLLSLHIHCKTVDWDSVKLSDAQLVEYQAKGQSNLQFIYMLLRESVRVVV
ncbi:hypothetical protein FDP41_005168 [Naegleria fowleri]|uniref:SAP domain-containing protein n=1 Tax=Naegleria fowleri TaxID=5763 RepID=A0A6A5BNI7_NAEFO|nr:uncharacterized protein FDP41_005168 [Naegleria fowleri]KAF0975841.1 hypothetical protein FDP41_005168 [Naegleria fowleri]CAG4708926.1 unnamed protein product [Naegleria fowleri]